MDNKFLEELKKLNPTNRDQFKADSHALANKYLNNYESEEFSYDTIPFGLRFREKLDPSNQLTNGTTATVSGTCCPLDTDTDPPD